MTIDVKEPMWYEYEVELDLEDEKLLNAEYEANKKKGLNRFDFSRKLFKNG